MDCSQQHTTMVFHPLIATDKNIKNKENKVECLHIQSKFLQQWEAYFHTGASYKTIYDLLCSNKNAKSSVSLAAATA